MRAKPHLITCLIALAVAQLACKNDAPDVPISGSGLFSVDEVVKRDDQVIVNLLNKVRGSVGRRGPASKTVWSRKNDYGLGLYISANHVYGLSSWPSRKAQFIDLMITNPGIFETSQLPPANGTIALGNRLSADFPFLHFDIPLDATNTTVLPAEDFYFGIVDNQRVEQGPFPQYPDRVQTTMPLQMYDPANRTKANQTWNFPVVGENAFALGYPQDKVNYPNGALAYGKILSDAEARSIVATLKAAGDAEGSISYDAEVEFFVNAQAIVGMSGGGVFNSEGQLLGIMVRASDTETAPKIIRVVKIGYMKSKLATFYMGQTESAKNKIRPFLSGEL